MNKIANAMENGEYDFDGTHDKTVSTDLCCMLSKLDLLNLICSRI